MAAFNVWLKPDGSEITLNDRPETEDMAKRLGFVLKVNAKKTRSSAKVTRSKKDADE